MLRILFLWGSGSIFTPFYRGKHGKRIENDWINDRRQPFRYSLPSIGIPLHPCPIITLPTPPTCCICFKADWSKALKPLVNLPDDTRVLSYHFCIVLSLSGHSFTSYTYAQATSVHDWNNMTQGSAGSIPDSYDIYRYLNLVRYSIFDTRYFRRKCNFVDIFRGYLKRLHHVHLLFFQKKFVRKHSGKNEIPTFFS